MGLRRYLWEHRIALAIILFALILRLIFLPYAKFENETVRDLTIANQMLDDGTLRLKGLSSEIDENSPQQAFGPLFYYLLAFSQVIWRHPYSAVALIAFLVAASGFLLYATLRRYFGLSAALVALSLFLFNPWVFFFVSLNFANTSFLIPLLILYFFSLCRIFFDHKDSYLTLTGISLASMLQFHLSSLLLLPVTFILLLMMRPSIFRSRFFYFTIGISAIFFVPYLLYTVQHDAFHQTFSFIFADRYSATRFENFRDSISISFMLATTYLGPYLLGTTNIFPGVIPIIIFLFDLLTSFVLGISLLWMLFWCIKRKPLSPHRRMFFLLLVLFLLPVILAIIPGKNVSPHYLFITYPSQFIILALFFDRFPLRRFLKISFLSLLLAVYFMTLFAFYGSLVNLGGTDGIYGIPLKSKINVLETVHQRTPEGYILFYDYVKPEYAYLQPHYAAHLTLLPHTSYEEGMEGYLLLDFYSRGNFAEKSMTSQERLFYQELPADAVGRLRLVPLQRYGTALAAAR